MQLVKSFFYIHVILFNMGMHLKNKKKSFKKKRLIILLILLSLISIFFYKVTSNISYYYLNYSIGEAKKIIDSATSRGINEKVLSTLKESPIYNISKNKNNEIEMIDYNSYAVNIFLKEVSESVSNSLLEEENKKESATFYVPVGVITKNPIFNNKGPKIPVKTELIGTVLSNVHTKVTEYGINNCMIEMSIRLEIEEKVILPISTDTIKITNDVPISYKIINGKIPTYYGNEISKASSIYKLPIE